MAATTVAAAVLAHAEALDGGREAHASGCAETLLLAAAGCFAPARRAERRCLRDLEAACRAHHALRRDAGWGALAAACARQRRWRVRLAAALGWSTTRTASPASGRAGVAAASSPPHEATTAPSAAV
jgi:hypothetical protein